MLRISDACKSFSNSKKFVLNNVSLEIQEGLITSLTGASGSGKTTLLRCIQGLEKLDSGTIFCDGVKGFVFQDFHLFNNMNIIDNLTYAPLCQKKDPDEVMSIANNLLRNLDIMDKSHAYPNQLSGGQKQRVALARSLVLRPNILLCDEPTSSLDFGSIKEVVSLLESVQSMGLSLIIASHDLDFVSRISDRLLLLKDGAIVLDVNPKQDYDDQLNLIEDIRNLY